VLLLFIGSIVNTSFYQFTILWLQSPVLPLKSPFLPKKPQKTPGFHRSQVEVTTEQGTFRAAVPSGASTGENEACELRDGGSDYMGKGCLGCLGWKRVPSGND